MIDDYCAPAVRNHSVDLRVSLPLVVDNFLAVSCVQILLQFSWQDQSLQDGTLTLSILNLLFQPEQ